MIGDALFDDLVIHCAQVLTDFDLNVPTQTHNLTIRHCFIAFAAWPVLAVGCHFPIPEPHYTDSARLEPEPSQLIPKSTQFVR